MNRIRWTPLAINDLKIISSYIEGQRNLATANRVCRIIYEAIQMLRRGLPGFTTRTRYDSSYLARSPATDH